MKNKTLLLSIILTFSSCGIFVSVTDTESTVNEVQAGTSLDAVTKFVGKYDITVFGVPDIGALELTMNVIKDGDELKTEIEAGEQESGLDILKTEVEEGILFIDAYVDSYGINISFEIYVDGNTVTGYLADMFELEGTITY
jgi:hypothetical protein